MLVKYALTCAHAVLLPGVQQDPAYMPQQMALTSGFMCILACDCNEKALSAESLAAFAESSQAPKLAKDTICSHDKPNYKDAFDYFQLAKMLNPLTSKPCNCK